MTPVSNCGRTGHGWQPCTRVAGHDGPCTHRPSLAPSPPVERRAALDELVTIVEEAVRPWLGPEVRDCALGELRQSLRDALFPYAVEPPALRTAATNLLDAIDLASGGLAAAVDEVSELLDDPGTRAEAGS